MMTTLQLPLDEDLATILQAADQPLERTALELIVLELYRRHTISSGKAAHLLGMDRGDFIVFASGLGIAYFDLSEEQWAAELQASEEIAHGRRSSPTPAP
jgi:hypothetical protein